MEILPVLMLWLCMPLDARPHFPPVRVEDLSLFPAEHVIRAERMVAWHRKLYAERRRDHARMYDLPDADYWCTVAKQAHHVWDQLDDIKLAYDGHSEEETLMWLNRFRKFSTPWHYMHGYIPPHVDLSEPVEVVPLP